MASFGNDWKQALKRIGGKLWKRLNGQGPSRNAQVAGMVGIGGSRNAWGSISCGFDECTACAEDLAALILVLGKAQDEPLYKYNEEMHFADCFSDKIFQVGLSNILTGNLMVRSRQGSKRKLSAPYKVLWEQGSALWWVSVCIVSPRNVH
jgi:hypothetical protein